jgi:hypothetical protein
MNLHLATRSAAPARRHAFSLLEILLVAAMMSVIVFGLYTMFEHTQRALRGNATQVDVQEAGRAALEIMTREIQQCAASDMIATTNLFALVSYPNSLSPTPMRQELETNLYRTNFLMDLFFLTKSSNYWTALGYFVASSSNATAGIGNDGVGSLYRFSPTTPPALRLSLTNVGPWISQFSDYTKSYYRTNSGLLADGIVHLRFKAFDRDGWPMAYNILETNSAYQVVYIPAPSQFTYPQSTNVVLCADDAKLDQTEFFFMSNAVPAYIEVELGILEPHAWERVKAMSTSQLKQAYLLKHAAQVHLFRKRIPIRVVSHES